MTPASVPYRAALASAAAAHSATPASAARRAAPASAARRAASASAAHRAAPPSVAIDGGCASAALYFDYWDPGWVGLFVLRDNRNGCVGFRVWGLGFCREAIPRTPEPQRRRQHD